MAATTSSLSPTIAASRRAEHKDRVARAVSVLRDIGVGAGDCIGIALRNCPQFFELLAAASALGAKAVPIAWRLKHEEVRYLVEDSQGQARVLSMPTAPARWPDCRACRSTTMSAGLARPNPRSDVDGGVGPVRDGTLFVGHDRTTQGDRARHAATVRRTRRGAHRAALASSTCSVSDSPAKSI